MRDIAVSLVIFGLIPYMIMRPHVGLLVWSWIGYMNPHRLAYGFAYSFPFVQLVAGITLVSMFFSKERKDIPWTPVTVVLVLFILWTCFTTLFAIYPDAALRQMEKVLKIQVMIFVTLMLMKDRRRLELLVWVIAMSIAFYGIKGGLFALRTGGAHRVLGPSGSFISGNNEIAFALCVIFPLLRYLQLSLNRRLLRWGMGGIMILCLIAIVSTYSRGAFLAGSAMLLFTILKSRNRLPLLLAFSIAIPLIINFMPDAWMQRMGTIKTYEQDGSAMGRINAWRFAFNLALDRPIVGGGFEVFQPEVFQIYAPEPENYHDSHSIYFEVLGEHGFVGLALFLALIFLSFRTASRVVRATREHEHMYWARDLAAMVQASMVGYLVGGAFIGLAYFDLLYHLIAIVVILEWMIQHQEVTEDSEARAAAGSGMVQAHESPYGKGSGGGGYYR